MPKREKPKISKGTQNESRKNGKAFKTGVKHQKTKMDPVMLVCMRKSTYVKFNRIIKSGK